MVFRGLSVPPRKRTHAAPAVALATALLCALPAGAAADFDTARRALERRDYTAAFALLQPLATRGDARAQDVVAAMYLEGLGVRKSVLAAMQWFCRLAHHRAGGRAVVHAVWNLAEYFRTGGGLPSRRFRGRREREDPIRGYFWYGVLANQRAFFARADAASERLGKLALRSLGRNLFAAEKRDLEGALRRWDPRREVRSGAACLRLPDGLAPHAP